MLILLYKGSKKGSRVVGEVLKRLECAEGNALSVATVNMVDDQGPEARAPIRA